MSISKPVLPNHTRWDKIL